MHVRFRLNMAISTLGTWWTEACFAWRGIERRRKCKIRWKLTVNSHYEIMADFSDFCAAHSICARPALEMNEVCRFGWDKSILSATELIQCISRESGVVYVHVNSSQRNHQLYAANCGLSAVVLAFRLALDMLIIGYRTYCSCNSTWVHIILACWAKLLLIFKQTIIFILAVFYVHYHQSHLK